MLLPFTGMPLFLKAAVFFLLHSMQRNTGWLSSLL
jgi:hypothetical protein